MFNLLHLMLLWQLLRFFNICWQNVQVTQWKVKGRGVKGVGSENGKIGS